ncbi:hypothetical protein N7474_010157 [Penicillium riverlandense]|uniref:uncharacterized protein n=1 Tax=Penicillium riverlandense TaxID=1903569 RepID=UPI0025484273|nr:uncharacterized protein N7474_010157 [Penicillium riverlandense]KAJ5808888.1 hypothetical protein N7474_010157 [Penicillium riverlandense]
MMTSAKFALDTFRPWIQSTPDCTVFDPVDLCRYPSPISIAETPISSFSGRGIALGKYEQERLRHPLPSRPPVDVCVNSSLPDSTPTAVVEVLSESPSAVAGARYPSTGITDENLQAQCEEHATSIDPSMLHLGFIADCTRTPTNDDVTFTGCRPLDEIASLGHDGPESNIMPTNALTVSKIRDQLSSKKPAGCSKRPRKKASPQRKKASSTTLQSQFSASPPDEKLQFLSWLFEAATSRCRLDHQTQGVTTPPTARSPELDVSSAPLHEQNGAAFPYTETHPDSHSLTRKGKTWTAEEKNLLVRLKEELGLPWKKVAREFSEQFPGRSKGSIEVYYCTTLKRERTLVTT